MDFSHPAGTSKGIAKKQSTVELSLYGVPLSCMLKMPKLQEKGAFVRAYAEFK